jgi:hypothetical protein
MPSLSELLGLSPLGRSYPYLDPASLPAPKFDANWLQAAQLPLFAHPEGATSSTGFAPSIPSGAQQGTHSPEGIIGGTPSSALPNIAFNDAVPPPFLSGTASPPSSNTYSDQPSAVPNALSDRPTPPSPSASGLPNRDAAPPPGSTAAPQGFWSRLGSRVWNEFNDEFATPPGLSDETIAYIAPNLRRPPRDLVDGLFQLTNRGVYEGLLPIIDSGLRGARASWNSIGDVLAEGGAAAGILNAEGLARDFKALPEAFGGSAGGAAARIGRSGAIAPKTGALARDVVRDTVPARVAVAEPPAVAPTLSVEEQVRQKLHRLATNNLRELDPEHSLLSSPSDGTGVPSFQDIRKFNDEIKLIRVPKGRLDWERHHALPQDFNGEHFTPAGLDIEDYVIFMPRADHRLRPNGIHTGPRHWNKRWNEFFDRNQRASAEQIHDFLNQLLDEHFGE